MRRDVEVNTIPTRVERLRFWAGVGIVALLFLAIFVPHPIAYGFIWLMLVSGVGRQKRIVFQYVGDWLLAGVRKQVPPVRQVLPKIACLFAIVVGCGGAMYACRGSTTGSRTAGELASRFFDEWFIWLAAAVFYLGNRAGVLFPGLSKRVTYSATCLVLLILFLIAAWPMIYVLWLRPF